MMVNFKIEYLPAINYALINNRIAVCQSVEIENTSAEDIHNISIECSGEFFQHTKSTIIDVVKAGKSARLPGIDIVPIPTRAATITEKLLTTFCIKIYSDDTSQDNRTEIYSNDYQVELMAYDQWLGTSILPQCLASFVLPNHPAIAKIVIKAAQILKNITNSSGFNEYQTGNPNDVRKQVAAIYGALHAENIVYRSAPPSYGVVGQRITLPDQVLSSKLGNCIELTILFASILESVGINCGIVLQEGHAYLAVWLVDDCCQYSVCDDASYVEKKCSEGIDEMLVLECTRVTAENTSFEEAQLIALTNLAEHSLFHFYLDIKRCRLEGILPLPIITQENGSHQIDTEGVNHDNYLLDVKEHSHYDLTKVMENKRELTRMDIWERKLLDFSLRNSMLNLRLRNRAIQFISFDVNLIEDYLQDGIEYIIAPKPNVDFKIPNESYLVRSKLMPNLHELITNDINHHTLHSFQTELETRDTLKNIYRASRNAIEETGANSLYLAIGALRWFETERSETPRYAPVLMLPVDMVYKKGEYYIRTRDEEISLNITLIEFLRQNYDITIPGLDPLPTDEHGVDVVKIFAIIREVLKNKKRWDVEEETVLGVFSFSKFLIWNDIHSHREEMQENDIVRSLVEQKLVFNPSPIIHDLKGTDKELKPEALALPVPVDSSQMAAIIEAGQGHSFILYGPPGTGKSQTITNLIANALFKGKRVLFVAEKMAALSVVQNRLEKIGLAPFCLEIHSNKVTKRHVLEQLKMALDVTHIVKPEEYSRIADQLFEQRTKLIEYMEALHDAKGTDGLSLYDCIVRFESIDAPELDIDTNDKELKENFRVQELDYYSHLLHDKYNAIINLIGQPSHHPLLGLNVQESDLANPSAMSDGINEAIKVINKGMDNSTKLSSAASLKTEILRDCDESIFTQDGNELYNEWRTVKAKWFLPRFFAKKDYIKRLRQYNPLIVEEDIDNFLGKLLEYNDLHQEIVTLQQTIGKYFDVHYQEDAIPRQDKAKTYTDKLALWSNHLGKARDWYQWCAYKKDLQKAGLSVIARKVESTTIPMGQLRDSFFKTMFKSLANEKIAQSSILRTFEGSIFDETVSRYQKLTEDFQTLSQKELYARLASQIPHVTDNIDHSSEIGFLNRNISNGGRGVPLRALMDQIPALLPRLCPCMLMSPMSVAQFLDLSHDKFDLVIFDEASQMPTSEAVGAIARGKAVVVVGDPKQMPPTSFFTSTNVSEDEADIDDMESILEDCRTLEIPALQLNWHYRSKHESLIAFSNNEYYDGSLITFPSVDDQHTKVKYHYVEGVYDKGGRRSNRNEAQAIVKEIAQRLKMPDHANNSIGVIAFSVVQQNLIEDMLMELLEGNKSLSEAAEEMYEPIFVKNLENVQGDERDIILFSIGYGPDKNGKVSMNFGPLNNAGGERRLNVAVSRARKEMVVFSTLKSSQIDLRRSKARGVEGLKHFLEYAEQQILIHSNNNQQITADTVIAEQIADALRKKGYTVSTNIGRSHFKVDVAVISDKNADNYSLGILLDGQGYHDTQTTRDREIVQPSVLRQLNWKVMRVWSVDWLNNPERVISRIEKAINEDPTPPEPAKQTFFDISNETVEEVKNDEKDYQPFVADANVATWTDRQLATAILSCEQPMTLMHLCRRICSIRGIARVTHRMQTSINNIARSSMFVQTIGTGTILWTDKEHADSFVGYRKNNGRDISEIPIIEVMNAVVEAVTEQFSINADALTLIVAKKLGFTKRGAKVAQALNQAVDILIADKRIVNIDGKLRLPDVQ